MCSYYQPLGHTETAAILLRLGKKIVDLSNSALHGF